MRLIKSPFVLFLFTIIPNIVLADLRIGFYLASCPQAESIVQQIVQQRFAIDRTITAALLRMHFHDCFVHGCDASILIDSTSQNQAEKAAVPNQTIRGFDLIDQIKEALESACPNTVSCADTIALATRDAVALARGPIYAVPTGRRDGLVSNVNDVILPGPSMTVAEAFQMFQAKGLTLADMVTLLGGHTVGVSHCSFFQDRLSNFQGTGAPDPSMDPSLVKKLSNVCASLGSDPTAFLDQNTSFIVDNEYYKQLLLKRGILQIDQEIANDMTTAGIVLGYAQNAVGFGQSFASAMVKLGSVQVLVGNAGQVRTNCSAFNSNNPGPTPIPRNVGVRPPFRFGKGSPFHFGERGRFGGHMFPRPKGNRKGN